MKVPRVSVIVPNFNYERYLRYRIDSILSQTFKVFEIIILDDCSDDGSVETINRIMSDNPNVSFKFIQNRNNSGNVFKQWEKGWLEASGDLIWIAEADDGADSRFLESLCPIFRDQQVVLAFSGSKLMDSEGRITAENCRSWMHFVSTSAWDSNFVMDGATYASKYLSVINSVPNVSGVVWRRLQAPPDFGLGREYKLCGDWAIYLEYLKRGNVGYVSQSLNFFRKHTGSVSARLTLTRENLREIESIFNYVEVNHTLDDRIRGLQNHRLRDEYQRLNQASHAKKVAILMPRPIRGSGGLRTIVSHANDLVRRGYDCSLFFEVGTVNDYGGIDYDLVMFYGENLCHIRFGIDGDSSYWAIFATHALRTPELIRYFKAEFRCYLVQDYEPWFEPMGDRYLEMERGYGYGYHTITIGNWLRTKVPIHPGQFVGSFSFCADLAAYKVKERSGSQPALSVCCIYQPEKSRRCPQLAIDSLRVLKKAMPEVQIYLFGSSVKTTLDFEAHQLGVLSPNELNDLYNHCTVGLCLSSSNPSRIPFEMMASGLPVVDLWREHNLYDFPSSVISLADPTPAALATALSCLLCDPEYRATQSLKARAFIEAYPIQRAYDEFENWLRHLASQEGRPESSIPNVTYKQQSVAASTSMVRMYEQDFLLRLISEQDRLIRAEAPATIQQGFRAGVLAWFHRVIPETSFYFSFARFGLRLLRKMLAWARSLKVDQGLPVPDRLGDELSPEDFDQLLRKSAMVSFDIFDTISGRSVLRPEDLFALMELKFRLPGFERHRIEADASIRSSLPDRTDVTLTSIYREVGTRLGLASGAIGELMEAEVELERALAVPILKQIAMVKSARGIGKRIVFSSDMYLPRLVIEKILNDSGIEWKADVRVSSETGLRKDNGTAYDALLQQNRAASILHVGDNLNSDVSIPTRKGIRVLHLRSSLESFGETSFGKVCGALAKSSPVWSLAVGLGARKVFANSAFDLRGLWPKAKPLGFRDYGYTFLGPLSLLFCSAIATYRNDRKLVFLAREGFFLKRIFEHFETCQGGKCANSVYFLASRSSALRAAISTEKDFDSVLPKVYKGMASELVQNLFLVRIDQEDDFQVDLSEERSRLMNLLAKYRVAILSEALLQRTRMTEYWNKVTGGADGESSLLVDLGYAGTIQEAYGKILGNDLHGLYFILNAQGAPVGQLERMLHVITTDEPDGQKLYEVSLILESFFTGPEGQFRSFEYEAGELIPVFLPRPDGRVSFSRLEEIFDGSVAFISDFTKVGLSTGDIFKGLEPGMTGYLLEYLKNVELEEQVKDSMFHYDEYYGRWHSVYDVVHKN